MEKQRKNEERYPQTSNKIEQHDTPDRKTTWDIDVEKTEQNVEKISKYKKILKEKLLEAGLDADDADDIDIYLSTPRQIRGESKGLSKILILSPEVNPESEIGINLILHEYFHTFFANTLRNYLHESDAGKAVFSIGKIGFKELLSQMELIENEAKRLFDELKRLFRGIEEKDEIFRRIKKHLIEKSTFLEARILYDYEDENKNQSLEDYRNMRTKKFCSSWMMALEMINNLLYGGTEIEEGAATYLACKIQGISFERFREIDEGVCHTSYIEKAKILDKDYNSPLDVISSIKSGQRKKEPFRYLKESFI